MYPRWATITSAAAAYHATTKVAIANAANVTQPVEDTLVTQFNAMFDSNGYQLPAYDAFMYHTGRLATVPRQAAAVGKWSITASGFFAMVSDVAYSAKFWYLNKPLVGHVPPKKREICV
jgi:hypothetical protein